MSTPDGRFAPSPSGPLHVGNLRTALLAWLFARSQGAGFLLRIEDLDPERSRTEYEQRARESLQRLGIDWDREVPRQSERRERHRVAFEQLRAAGRVYPCWCTRAEVARAAAAPHGPSGGAYPGTCRELSAAERGAREAGGRPAAWRLDARAEVASFRDALHGEQSAAVDDFVLWRGDDVPAYNLAVVIDDADDGIGEVVRGDDLLETTPRQVALGELLALPVPSYVHVPLVLAHDGKRLAKHHTDDTTTAPGERGEGVEELIGWMAASVGLVEAGARLSARELLARFDAGRLAREATLLETGPR